MNFPTRRRFITVGSTALAATVANPAIFTSLPQPPLEPNEPRTVVAFVKYLQQMPFDKLAASLAEIGFQGIEATIRPGGMIAPEDASKRLPELVEALRKEGLSVEVMTTAVSDPDDETSRELLETAASLGVKRYRTAYYRYDLKRPILPQLDALRPTIEKLAKLNEQLGITGVYQNHAGARNVGSTVWDLQRLFEGINPAHLGIAFDIRHAVVCGGSSWPILWDLVKPQLQAVYVKDFSWVNNQVKNVALGQGAIPRSFFKQLKNDFESIPLSLHVEYLGSADARSHLDALNADLVTLRKWLRSDD